jgi:hypothetical protein
MGITACCNIPMPMIYEVKWFDNTPRRCYFDSKTGAFLGFVESADKPPPSKIMALTEPKHIGPAVTDFRAIKRRLDEITGAAFCK